jgi:hypothetical protein
VRVVRVKMGKHNLEGLRVRCGDFFGTVKHGRCSECHKLVIIMEVNE